MSIQPGYDFTVYYVADLDKSLDFFLKLGFEDVVGAGGPGFHQIRGKAGSLDFGISQAGKETPSAGTIELYYKVNDIEVARQAVLAKGVEASPIMKMPFGTIFQTKSPDGNSVYLMQE